MQTFKIIIVNVLVLVVLLIAVEVFFRLMPSNAKPIELKNGLAMDIVPYVMFVAEPHGRYTVFVNEFTSESIPANITANNWGFNDRRDFSLTELYKKADNERVVLFTGGSTVWGVGSTSPETTIAGRMEYYLNSLQKDAKYTVVNLAMGSWIAYQQFVGLELWGAVFRPDWVVVMDGHNDAGVGCGYSQGVMNPHFFPVMKSYMDAYLFKVSRPVFFRGWLENEIIKHSVAYRSLTGKEYIRNPQVVDATNTDTTPGPYRNIIIPTKIGESRQMLAFYLKAQEAMLALYPNARYILSTQPMVNNFKGDFTDVYDTENPELHRAAVVKRIQEVDFYLAAHEKEPCQNSTYQPSFVYLYVKGALEVERLAERMRDQGRYVEYHNMGRLLPNDRESRMPYFIDPAHLSDKGADVLGKFYAERILAAGAVRQATENSSADRVQNSAVAVPGETGSVPATGLYIRSATYGANCGASEGNATIDLRELCDGKQTCEYGVDVEHLGDPAPRCSKTFVAEFACAPDTTTRRREIPAEAGFGSRLHLSCENVEATKERASAAISTPPLSGLDIHSATYGANCGAPEGNATTDLRELCDGKQTCEYRVDVEHLGDPAPGCSKTFVAEFACAPDTRVRRQEIPAEAGFGSQLQLSCQS